MITRDEYVGTWKDSDDWTAISNLSTNLAVITPAMIGNLDEG